jgi:hypothetical protein
MSGHIAVQERAEIDYIAEEIIIYHFFIKK